MTNAIQSANPSIDEPESKLKLWWFYLVVLVAVLYCGFLIGLAVYATFFSHPIVLNLRQLRDSPLIVTATLESGSDEGSELRLQHIWKGRTEKETVFVRDLPASQLQGSEEWIVPLTPVSSNILIVTPLRYSGRHSDALIYPADPATINKLKSLLSSDESSL